MMKARDKGSPNWKNFKSCSIGISLKSPNHTGEALGAIVDWMNGKFEYCTIDLTDSLERINIADTLGISEEEARKEANRLGDEWIQNNGAILSNLRMPMSLLRWDHWHSESNKPKLERLQTEFKRAARNNSAFSYAIDSDVNRFYERRFGLRPNEITSEQRDLSRRYLIEEMAGHSLLYKDYRSATIYPGAQQESFKMLREGKVDGVSKGLLNSYYTRLVVYDPSQAPGGKEPGSDTIAGKLVSEAKAILVKSAAGGGGVSLLPFRNNEAIAYSPA